MSYSGRTELNIISGRSTMITRADSGTMPLGRSRDPDGNGHLGARPVTTASPGCHKKVFPGTPEEARHARQWVAELLGPEHPLRDAAELVASELATNAVLHTVSGRGGGSFTVEVSFDGRAVLLWVLDEGSASQPLIAKTSDQDAFGRGLEIVNFLCEEWSTILTDDGWIIEAVLVVK
jgi:anti-sigma regulatory factor (Ser/Thr protein kinase)